MRRQEITLSIVYDEREHSEPCDWAWHEIVDVADIDDVNVVHFEPSEPATTYKIVRFFQDFDHPDHGKVIRTGLTLDEAQEHCTDESTHGEGWFDGYTEE